MNLQSLEGPMKQYTNEITTEIRETHSQPPYDKALLALCDSQACKELEGISKREANRSFAYIFQLFVVGSLSEMVA